MRLEHRAAGKGQKHGSAVVPAGIWARTEAREGVSSDGSPQRRWNSQRRDLTQEPSSAFQRHQDVSLLLAAEDGGK